MKKKRSARKQEWLLLGGSVLVTLLVALALIRWFAPSLLGFREDLQVVRVGKTIAPFFEGVFRSEDYSSNEFILNDPYTRVRAKPLMSADSGIGPHDVLGFRNHSVPNVVDIMAIGDSQTYGNNVALEENWPSHLLHHWRTNVPVIYNMSTGGWGAVQYLDMFRHAAVFQPRVVIVAFYSGNDSLESFILAYSQDRYAALRPDSSLRQSDLPPGMVFPPPPEDLWKVSFKDGSRMTFSPKHRLSSNNADYPAVRAGYAIMREVARRIATLARSQGIHVVFTVIPSKELSYAARVQRDAIKPSTDYERLVTDEKANIATLATAIREIPEVSYVDLVAPLQAAILDGRRLYPENENGHPVSAGYRAIANAIAPVARKLLPPPVHGLFLLPVNANQYRILLVTSDGVRDFASERIALANNWKTGSAERIRQRDIAMLPYRGVITTTDPARYGPGAFR